MACTGIEFCKLAIVETKARGCLADRRTGAPHPGVRRADHHQHQRLPERLRPYPGRGHRSQGPAGPGRPTGEQVEGYQVHLGGALGLEAGFGRKVRGLKVTSDELPDYVERVLKPLPGRSARTASGSPPGRRAPTRRRCHERASRPVLLPYCGDEDLRPNEAGPRRLGMRGLQSRLPAEVPRAAGPGAAARRRRRGPRYRRTTRSADEPHRPTS